jgi:hypothetical protein
MAEIFVSKNRAHPFATVTRSHEDRKIFR